jgi:hypothetical protein
MMSITSQPLASIVLAVVVLVVNPGEQTRRPDFSGKWVLLEALMTGPGRDGAAGADAAPRRTSSITLSGAALNCGRGCTITLKGQSLTVSDALLAGFETTGPAPSVTIRLDAREQKVIDTFSPSRELMVTASWQGDSLQIKAGPDATAMTQLVSIEKNQLVVRNRGRAADLGTIYRYAKK